MHYADYANSNRDTVKVVLEPWAIMPERAHTLDAGLDLKTPGSVCVRAHGSVTIDTGVHMEIPAGYFGKLESKSGLNVKHGVVSCGGVVDAGYTGSIVVKLYNLTDRDYWFSEGDKICQLVIIPCRTPVLELVDSLEDTERGSNGFGSTGK